MKVRGVKVAYNTCMNTMQKASAALDRAVTWLLYGLILVLPMTIGWGFYEVARPSKVTVLKLAAALLLLLWASSCALSGELKWRRTPLDIPLAGLLVTVVVSTIFSMNRQASLFGAIRREGLWIYFIYALVYYLSAWYLGRGKIWLTALRLVALSSAAPALMTVLQLLGADLSGLFGTEITPYAAAFGYRPFYAYYLVLVIPVFFYLAWREKGRWRRYAWAAGGAVNLAILPLTNNRASILGLFATALAAVMLLSLRSSHRRRILLGGLGALVLASLLLFGITWGTTYGGRLRAGVNASDGNSTTRLSMWQSSLRMIADRPIQGYGLESFYCDYPRYMNEDLYDLVSIDNKYFIYDHPHNQALYMGVSLGVGGLFFYLLLYFLLFRCLFRAFRRQEDHWFYGAVFCCALASFICAQFMYDLPPYTFYLWVLAGTAVGRLGAGAEPEEAPQETAAKARKRSGLNIAVSCAALCLAAAVAVTTSVYAVRIEKADRVAEAARETAMASDLTPENLPSIISEARRGLDLDPCNTNLPPLLYDKLMLLARLTGTAAPAWEVIEEARQESLYYPTGFWSYFTLGKAYAYLYETTGLEEYREEAVFYLERARQLYPWLRDIRNMLDSLDQQPGG